MLNCITKKTMFKSHREHQQHPNMTPMDDKQQCQPSNQPTFFNFSPIAKQLTREMFLKMQVLARSLWVSCPGLRVNADISSHELWNPLELSSPLCWSTCAISTVKLITNQTKAGALTQDARFQCLPHADSRRFSFFSSISFFFSSVGFCQTKPALASMLQFCLFCDSG